MIVHRYVTDLLSSNMYVVEENGHAIVIDPCRNTDPGQNLNVDMILLTHEHYDHISGVNAWKEKYGCKLLCNEICSQNIASTRNSSVEYFEVFCEIQTWDNDVKPDIESGYVCFADEIIDDNTTIEWQGHRIDIFAMPGHSKGSSGIVIDDKFFFSGDSMSKDYPVSLRFPGGSKKLWNEISIPILKKLPSGMTVCPGHFEEFEYDNSKF